MKKLFYILLAAVLCIAFFSCKDVPEVTPNEIESVSPEVVTPNEIEVITPSEPKSEEPEQTDENIIMLPEADENTKYITIEFPEDFPEEPYTEPNLVSPEEFEWGEYVPFVRYEADRYNRREFFEKYAFLTESAVTLEDGNEIYNNLNNKYLAEYDIPDRNILFGSGKTYIESKNFDIKDMLFKSRIIHVSEDMQTIGRFSLILPHSQIETENLIDADWHSKFELISDNKTVYSEESNIVINYTSGIYNKYENWKYQLLSNDLWFEGINNSSLVYVSNNSVIIEINSHTDNENEQGIYYVYSIDDKKLLYTLQLKSKAFNCDDTEIRETIDIEQIIDDRYLLLECCKIYNDLDGFYSAHYLYDMQTQKTRLLRAFAENAVISPDGNYLAYTDAVSEIEQFENNLIAMKRGFYITELDTGNTTFFDYSEDRYFGSEHFVQGWVNKKALIKVIE